MTNILYSVSGSFFSLSVSGCFFSLSLSVSHDVVVCVCVCVCVCVVLCLEAELCEQLDCFKRLQSTRRDTARDRAARHHKSAEKQRERRNFTQTLSFGRLRNNDKPVAVTGD